MKIFDKLVEVKWADVDQNGHVRHSAYYDYGAHVRVCFIQASGYDADALRQLALGPILFHEQCSFIREIKLNEVVTINMLKGEVSEDGSRWTVHHELFNSKKEKLAHITAKGAWMDLNARKLSTPPKQMADAFHLLVQGENYKYQKT